MDCKRNDQSLYCLQETHFRSEDTNMLKVKGWANTRHANSYGQRAEAAILTLDKTDSETKILTREKIMNVPWAGSL